MTGAKPRVRPAEASGIFLMLASCALLTLGDAVAKLLTETYPVGQVIFIRSAIIVVLMVAVCAARRRMRDLAPRSLHGQLARGALFAAATFCFVSSISMLPLPVVSAIMFAAPIILTALAGPLLGEMVGWRRWLAVIAGFCGVLLIVNPVGGGWGVVALLPILGAFLAAMRDLVTRRVAARETTASVLVVSMGITMIPGLATAPFGWSAPPVADAGLFLLMGVTTGIAFHMQVGAFRLAEAGLIAPFKYSIIVWSTLLGFLIWGDLPTLSTIVGAAVVVASGVFIFHREMRRARQRGAPDEAAPHG